MTGPEVSTLLAALANANALTPWVIGGQAPTLVEFRPLLPERPRLQGLTLPGSSGLGREQDP